MALRAERPLPRVRPGPLGRALVVALALAGCAQGTTNGFTAGQSDIAAQRVRFAAEAVCLNNTTRRAQDRAARGLNFPVRQTEPDGATVFVNPGTLTFLRLGPAPEQTIAVEGGTRTIRGSGCSVGSPAVGRDLAQRLAGEILAPRLVDGSDTLQAPIGAGRNAEGGLGFFFDRLSVTLPLARTAFVDPQANRMVAFEHPVILVVHR
jgi:hypothetical protein